MQFVAPESVVGARVLKLRFHHDAWWTLTLFHLACFRMRISYQHAIANLDLLAILRSFDPIVIGTPPLGIDIAESDIDIACCCDDLQRFTNFASGQFGSRNGFQIQLATLQDVESAIVHFKAFEWDFEIFCQPIPTREQWGVRHFLVEQRLLAISPDLKSIVTELKRSGLKTEAAFADALALAGDPYVAILGLERFTDCELLALTQTQ